MEQGLVTVIIPVFNRAAMLREAVESAAAQSYRPLEIIVVDDGSTDDTLRAVERLAAEHAEVRSVRQANGGAGAARESGRRLARGEFIQHLDSDDVLLPAKLERQVAGLRSHPECGASYGWTRLRRADGRVEDRPWKRSGERIETMFPAMLQSRWWDTPTPLYRASLLEKAGPWSALRVEEDWEYDARLASHGVRLHFVDDWVCEVRQHEAGHASGGGLDPRNLRDRATAHAAIFRHAQRAGISAQAPEMQHFARELFLLARQCGAAGLPAESKSLFALSREAAGPGAGRLQFRVYAAVARTIGWGLAGKLATVTDRMRPR